LCWKGKRGRAIGNIQKPLIRSFWESRTLFSKRVLAAGGIGREKGDRQLETRCKKW
jgi:hypothetical protein